MATSDTQPDTTVSCSQAREQMRAALQVRAVWRVLDMPAPSLHDRAALHLTHRLAKFLPATGATNRSAFAISICFVRKSPIV